MLICKYANIYQTNDFFIYVYNIEWIFIQHCSGFVHCFLLCYRFIYYVVQKELQYFTPRSPPAVVCL